MKLPLSILGTASQIQAAVMPTGAVGLWYADQYTASPRKLIPNAIASASPSTNILLAHRRLFTSEFYSRSSMTVTEGISAPDGTNDATRIQGTGNWFINPVIGVPSLAAGTYTIEITAKLHAGIGSQQFRMGPIGAPATITVTGTWATHRATFSMGAGTPTILALWNLASADGDVDIIDFCMYAGDVNPTESALDGHIYLNNPVTYASGAVDLSPVGGFGLSQFPDDLALTEFTIIALLRKKINTGANFNGILGGFSTQFSVWLGNSASPINYFRGSNRIVDNAIVEGFDFYNKGWKTVAHRINADSASLFINGSRVVKAAYSPGAAVTVMDLLFGPPTATTYRNSNEYAALALYPMGLTDAEIRQAEAALEARAATSGITLADNDITLIFEGDSITAATDAYCTKYPPNATVPIWAARYAVSGNSISDLNSRAAEIDAIIPAKKGSQKFVLSVLIGRNDLLVLGTSTWLTTLATYLDARRAAGWTVVLCTILPATASGFNAARNTANTTLRTWVGTHCDAIIDFAADATMGPDAAASNGTYYSDGTHPTAAGQVILETVARPVLNAL